MDLGCFRGVAGAVLGFSLLVQPDTAVRPLIEQSGQARRGASLFVGKTPQSLFAQPRPVAPDLAAPDMPGALNRALRGSQVEQLRSLIAVVEAGRAGYDAVQHGARIKPPKRPTQMTINEIYAWIKATPGQPHAIGRYQFIPPTLRSVVARAGVDPRSRFSPQVQDRLGDVLLADAGLHRLQSGQISRVAFMNGLAKIWAGLPNSTGKSHYHGYAGNKAGMSWQRFNTAMARIFPDT